MRLFLIATTLSLAFVVPACVGPEPDPGAAKLAEFETLSHAAAVAEYAQLPTADKVVLWVAQFDRVLATGLLSPSQAAFVADVRAQIGPIVESPATWAATYARAQTVMTEDEIERYLGTLGDRRARSDAAVWSATGACDTRWNCSSGCYCGQQWSGTLPGSNNECFYYTCTSACAPTSTGCGLVWQQACDKTMAKGAECVES